MADRHRQNRKGRGLGPSHFPAAVRKGHGRIGGAFIVLALMIAFSPPGLSAQKPASPVNREASGKLNRYKNFLENPDERRRYYKEYMDLFIYFNYDAGADAILSGGEAGRNLPVPRKANAGLKKVILGDRSIEPVPMGVGSGEPAGVADPLAVIIDEKIKEIDIPDSLRRYLAIENWEANLDGDPYPERILSIRLSLATANEKPAFPGDPCSRLQFAQIIFLVDPASGPDDFGTVQTLSKQNRIENVCACVGCFKSKLLDVYDFDEDGTGEIIIVDKIYDTVRYTVYGLRKGVGYTAVSRHHYLDS